MNEIIATTTDFLTQQPLWIWAAGGAALVLVIILAVSGSRRLALRKAAAAKMDQGEQDPDITRKLLKKPAVLERLIREKGDEVIEHFDVAEHLIRKLAGRGRSDIAKRLLRLAPELGAFPVFLTALKNSSVAGVFHTWLEEDPEFMLIRRMALSAKGRDFNGEAARKLLDPVMESIRELSGDPEWPVRFFTLRVILGDPDAKSRRLVDEAFTDSHPLIRKTAAAEADYRSSDELFDCLMSMVLDDPVPEVRQSARARIEKDFPGRWQLDPSGLEPRQAVHILEQLKIGSNTDENAAIVALQGENIEARLAAARFLEKAETLERIFDEADRGDLEDWERRRQLLSNAISVGVNGFLARAPLAESTGVQLLGAYLLSEGGDTSLIAPLADKAFSRPHPTAKADDAELYRIAAALACTRGDLRARVLLREEIKRRRTDPELLGYILPQLPSDEAPVFKDVLLEFLVDPDFQADKALEDIISRLPPSLFLGTVLDILESDRSTFGHKVRLRAMHCLGSWHLEYTLQTILENLPVLERDEAREFAAQLADMNPKALKERAAFILASPDAGVRASLIASLPAGSVNSFSKEIREGLNDPDPEVRMACLRALFDAGEIKAVATAMDLLRDPVERVRIEAARLSGEKGSPKFIKALEEVLVDTGESRLVRLAALEGLSAGTTKEAVDVLVHFLDKGEDMRSELTAAMAVKTDRISIAALVEHFKDSEAVLRDKMAEVFTAMGEAGEEALVALLREDIASLKSFLADILTRTGYVEVLVRSLGHRKPEIRREAAGILAEIGTEPAYRGVVLAARDPDREVRVQVTRALESLATPEGETILKSLEEDPDRKVRRYTHWAMERLRAKKLP